MLYLAISIVVSTLINSLTIVWLIKATWKRQDVIAENAIEGLASVLNAFQETFSKPKEEAEEPEEETEEETE